MTTSPSPHASSPDNSIWAWPDHRLTMAPHPAGLWVGQEIEGERQEYLVRGWAMSPSLRRVIDVALAHGLTCLLQNGHPQSSKRGLLGDGAVYLSFARRPEEYWVLVVNDRSGKPTPSGGLRTSVDMVLFNHHYRHALEQAGVEHAIEPYRSASNMEVPVAALEQALAACAPYIAHHAPRSGKRGAQGAYPGFRDEADIERHLWQRLQTDRCFLGRAITPIERQLRIANGFIDILVRDDASGGIIVIEIKQGRAQKDAVLTQLPRYVQHDDIRALAAGRPIAGVLVAEHIDAGVIAACQHLNIPERVLAVEVAWKGPASISLVHRYGSWRWSDSFRLATQTD